MERKLKVFVSCSFEPGDERLVRSFMELLKQPRLHLDVRTAEAHQSRPFAEKIKDGIRWADITLGIFTRKFEVKQKAGTPAFVPPPYVVSECSYAYGLYDKSQRSVHGFVEDGIDYKRIGLNVAEGQEFPSFRRADILAGNLKKIEAYVRDIRQRHFESAQATQYPYIQQKVKKTVYVFRSGSALFKNTVRIYVRDASKVAAAGGIPHSIWLPRNCRASFPTLDSMFLTRVSQHITKPVFYAALLKIGEKDHEIPLKVKEASRNNAEIRFTLEFPMTLKDHDHLEYQYVWGMPGIFFPSEEQVIASALKFQEVALKAHHGEIGESTLRIHFERSNIYGTIPELFSKRPYVLFTPSTREDDTSLSDAVEPNVRERDSAFDTYEHSCDSLTGAMIMRWVPISRRHQDGGTIENRAEKRDK